MATIALLRYLQEKAERAGLGSRTKRAAGSMSGLRMSTPQRRGRAACPDRFAYGAWTRIRGEKSDERGKKLCSSDMHRTVDQVMSSMADPEFDRFTSGVIADVSRKLGRDDIANSVLRKQKDKDSKKSSPTSDRPETESESKTVEPIPA